MQLTPEQISHIALLARLELSDEENSRYAEQLSSILAYVGKLQEVDTSKIRIRLDEGITNRYRDDQVEPVDAKTRDALLAQAPERSDDLYQVKGVFS